jgi:uncharacterized protein
MRKIFLVMCLGISLAGSAYAHEEALVRLITVAGEGEVLVVPDEVMINLTVETFDPKLADAKNANDEAIKKVLELVKKYKIDSKDFQTNHISVRNDLRYYFDEVTNVQRQKKGFFVTKNVAILLRNINQLDALYSDALTTGVNNIYGVTFRTSAQKKHREDARALALRAAKEKAVKMAAELGQEISRPYAIQENSEISYPMPQRMNMAMMAKDSGAEVSNETIALGQIKVTASVVVSFELK